MRDPLFFRSAPWALADSRFDFDFTRRRSARNRTIRRRADLLTGDARMSLAGLLIESAEPDQITLTEPGLLNLDEGSIYVEWSQPAMLGTTAPILQARRTDSNNSILLALNAADKPRAIVNVGGVAVFTATADNAAVPNTTYRLALSFADGAFACAFSAALKANAVTQSSGAVPTGTLTSLRFGQDGSNYLEGEIHRMAWKDVADSAADLLAWAQQSLTAETVFMSLDNGDFLVFDDGDNMILQ